MLINIAKAGPAVTEGLGNEGPDGRFPLRGFEHFILKNVV